VKLTRTFLALAALAVVVVSSRAAYASSGCPDDPERCVERGASMTHRAVASTPATVVVSAPAHAAPTATTLAHKAPAAAPTRKSAGKSARAATPAPATPGMGMLLKLSNGNGGEVSLFPSKPTEKTAEASWVL